MTAARNMGAAASRAVREAASAARDKAALFGATPEHQEAAAAAAGTAAWSTDARQACESAMLGGGDDSVYNDCVHAARAVAEKAPIAVAVIQAANVTSLSEAAAQAAGLPPLEATNMSVAVAARATAAGQPLDKAVTHGATMARAMAEAARAAHDQAVRGGASGEAAAAVAAVVGPPLAAGKEPPLE